MPCIPLRSRPAPEACLPGSAGRTAAPAAGSPTLCAADGTGAFPCPSTGLACCARATRRAAAVLLTRTSTDGRDRSSRGWASSSSSGESTASLASSDRIWSSWQLYGDLPAGGRTAPEPRFARVVCLAGFCVVLPVCGQARALHRLPRLRQRADALLASPSRHPSAPLQTASGCDGALDDRLSGAGGCQTAILRGLTLIS